MEMGTDTARLKNAVTVYTITAMTDGGWRPHVEYGAVAEFACRSTAVSEMTRLVAKGMASECKLSDGRNWVAYVGTAPDGKSISVVNAKAAVNKVTPERVPVDTLLQEGRVGQCKHCQKLTAHSHADADLSRGVEEVVRYSDGGWFCAHCGCYNRDTTAARACA